MVVFVIPATNFLVSKEYDLKPIVVERAPTTEKKIDKILHECK